MIAIDFDGTLDNDKMQRFILKVQRENNEVWVITARRENEYNKNILKPVLDKCYISEHQVIYCDDKPKVEMIQAINADIYIDNITTEFEDIQHETNTIPLWFNQ